MNSMKGLVTILTQWRGLIRWARLMVCFTPFMMMWLECMARLLRALSPLNSETRVVTCGDNIRRISDGVRLPASAGYYTGHNETRPVQNTLR